jgi:hypothetical protein
VRKPLIAILILLSAAPVLARSAWADPPPPSPSGPAAIPAQTPPPFALPPPADSTALQLFAEIEAAWSVSNAERLASMVDTTVVRIGLKPGAPPASAVTRNAAAFLFRDQLRLVETRAFRFVRVEVGSKGTARATARWTGDWGGRQGVRDVEVVFNAVANGGRWSLTEVRAND